MNAQAQALYTIENIHVDIEADNALEARDKAFIEAQRKAFLALAKEIMPPEEVEAFILPEDISQLSSLINDFELVDEKLSDVRYIGTYIFRFKKSAVEQYFAKDLANQTLADTPARKSFLILPFYQDRHGMLIWSERNPWLQAWRQTDNPGGDIPIVIPIGDIQDVNDIGDRDALSYNQQNMRDLLSRYQTAEAVLAIAVADEALSDIGPRQPAAGALSINFYRTDGGPPRFMEQIIVSARGNQNRDAFFEGAAERASYVIRKNIENEEANREKINHLPVRMQFESLQDWIGVQRDLNKIYTIQNVAIKSMNPRSARLDLVFKGDMQLLRSVLQQAGFILRDPGSDDPQLQQGQLNTQQPDPQNAQGRQVNDGVYELLRIDSYSRYRRQL